MFPGPPGWNSRSLYFFGPEEIILEYIAHDVDAVRSAGTGPGPNPLGIYEIGVVVPDVPAAVAVAELTDGFGGSPPEHAGLYAGLSPLTAAVAAAGRGVVHRHAAGVEGQCAALAEKFGVAAAAALDP